MSGNLKTQSIFQRRAGRDDPFITILARRSAVPGVVAYGKANRENTYAGGPSVVSVSSDVVL